MCTSHENQPLYIDPEVEASQQLSKPGIIQRITKWLHMHLPLILHYELPRGRKSIATQLIGREYFATELWKMYGDTDTIVEILKVLKVQRNWPNHHFVPDDSLLLTLIPECADEVATMVFYSLNNRFDVRYADDEIFSLMDRDSTVGELVSGMLHKIAAESNH